MEESVDKFETKGQRLVALSMLGCLVFNYPVLALFNGSGTVLGIPLLYFFIFAAWGLLAVAWAGLTLAKMNLVLCTV
jgi:hypothetical protein